MTMATPSTKKPTKKTASVPRHVNGTAQATVAPAAAPGKPAVTVSASVAKSPKIAKSPKAPKAPNATKPKALGVKQTVAVEAQPVSAATEQKARRVKKEKVVRDSFTMPKSDYDKLAVLKQKCLGAGVAVKKSELLRAGLLLLEAAPLVSLLDAIAAVETVKTGRPAKPARHDTVQ
jgi:hypothetical protein